MAKQARVFQIGQGLRFANKYRGGHSRLRTVCTSLTISRYSPVLRVCCVEAGAAISGSARRAARIASHDEVSCCATAMTASRIAFRVVAAFGIERWVSLERWYWLNFVVAFPGARCATPPPGDESW